MSDDGSLVRLDAALLDLRRFAEPPGAGRRGQSLAHGAERVEVSTLLVVDAVARHDAATECGIGDVAGHLHVAHSTASRLVERAVGAGMLRSRRSTVDPRRVVLLLTADGRRLQDHAVRFRLARLEELLADWPAADVATFARLLERFARAAYPPTKEKP